MTDNIIGSIISSRLEISDSARRNIPCAAVALEVIQRQSIDLLLSDIMMPQMNGLELARRIKADYPLVKVQLISGFADSSMVSDEESKAWFEQRLAKPVPMTTLLQRVSQLVSSR